MRFPKTIQGMVLLASISGVTPAVLSQTLGPDFKGAYQIRDLGAAGDVPTYYGGMVFKAGDNDTLLLGGYSEDAEANIYAIKVKRDAGGHISGFANVSTVYAAAPGIPPELELDPQGGLSSGLSYGPNQVLFYSSYHDGGISQIKQGSAKPDKQNRRRNLGMGDTWGGGLVFVPAGFPGEGRLKLSSFDIDGWFDTTVTADGNGTYTILPPTQTVSGMASSAESILYVKAGKPSFPKTSVLLNCSMDDRVVAYEVDNNGDPIPATLRPFITDFPGASGSTVDPVTGDFLFAPCNQNAQIVLVGNLTANPAQVRITAPTDGSTFTAPATFSITAEAQETGGLISHVDYYQGKQFLLSVAQAPYSGLIDNLSAGNYAFTAVAVDGAGNSVTSSVVHVTVQDFGPGVTLIYPTNNTTLRACSGVNISVKVQPGNSDIASVEFFDGAQLLNINTDPYDFQTYSYWLWHMDEGVRTMSVRVTAKNGLSTTAVATNVVIQPLPLHTLVAHHYSKNQIMYCFKGQVSSNYVWETSGNLTPKAGNPVLWSPVFTNAQSAVVVHLTNNIDWSGPPRFYRTRQSN